MVSLGLGVGFVTFLIGTRRWVHPQMFFGEIIQIYRKASYRLDDLSREVHDSIGPP